MPLYNPSTGGGIVDSIVEGTNVSIDNTDPANPIISADAYATYVQADEPVSGTDGQIWLDTDDNQLYIYVSGAWVAISGGGAPSGGTFDFIDGTSFDFVDGTYFDFIT